MFIIFFILLIISTGVLVYIIIKKFPQLVNLDIDSLPQERINQTKKKIINKRLSESSGVLSNKLSIIFKPFNYFWKKVQNNFRTYVNNIYNLWRYEDIVQKKHIAESSGEEKEIKIQSLLDEAEENFINNHLDEAESYYISVISLDNKNITAYRGLADIYFNKQELEEARQTLLFLTRLDPDDDSSFIKLAEIAESQDNIDEAIEYYQKAVLINDALSPRFFHLAELLLKVDQPIVAKEAIIQAVALEPQNPKYLDLLIEIGIICHDKHLALRGYNELRVVNEDNKKLDSFRDRIDQLKIEGIKS